MIFRGKVVVSELFIRRTTEDMRDYIKYQLCRAIVDKITDYLLEKNAITGKNVEFGKEYFVQAHILTEQELCDIIAQAKSEEYKRLKETYYW